MRVGRRMERRVSVGSPFRRGTNRGAAKSSDEQVVELVGVVLFFLEDVFEKPAGGRVRGA